MQIKPFKLERFYAINEFTAKYLLCSSDCEAMTIKELLALEEGAAEKFQNQWLGYTETKGNPSLKRDIATFYDTIKSNDVIVCSGAQEPIFLFANSILSAEDEIIVQSPNYQSLQSVPESLGCKVLTWEVNYMDEKPTFDIDELEKLITNKTKVIYVNNPHNPTGFYFSKAEQLAVVELARKNNILIFSDEVYRGLEHKPEYAIPAFADVYENGVSLVSLGVMSKSLGLPGLRIGWLATKNGGILEKVEIMKDYTTICNAAPSEFLAGVGLRNRATILARNLKIVEKNLSLLDVFFEKYRNFFSWYRPNAGPISFVKLKFTKDDMAFCQKVLDESKVLLLPSGIYDYEGFFRVGFCRENMPEALEKFEEFVIKNLK